MQVKNPKAVKNLTTGKCNKLCPFREGAEKKQGLKGLIKDKFKQGHIDLKK